MMEKVYLSNISKGWPIARQQAALGNRDPVYMDVLGRGALKRRSAADLKERAGLLRFTTRQTSDSIVVASFACIAWNWLDFGDVLAAAAARNATLIALDTGLHIPPNAGADVLNQAMHAFAKAVRAPGVEKGRHIAAALKVEDTKRRIERIRPFWHLREPSTRELLTLAGDGRHPMAPATAKAHLGSRPAVQAEYERKQERAAKRKTK